MPEGDDKKNEDKKKKNAPPPPGQVRRKRKKGAANAVKIPTGSYFFQGVINSLNSCYYLI